jgi:hypothetical protein
MEGLTEVLASRELSDWARWVTTSTELGARETLLFLERAFDHLPNKSQQRIGKRRKADSGNVDALLHELLLYEVCYEFRFDPEFEPEMARQTPDFALKIAGQTYIADVFLTNRPKNTLIESGGFSGYRDRGEAAKKIADMVSEKAAKYRRLQPLILFVVFAGHDIRANDLETAIYGATLHELLCTGGLTKDCHEDWHRHGVFCPPGPKARHREVSAIVGCDWFDTLARGNPGRRLHCVVYHHWQPCVALSLESFGRFPDVHWRNESGRFIPAICGEPNLVMSTTSRK